jgi:hypothetical protein
MLDFNKFVEWAFLAIIGGSVAWASRFLGKISCSISELNSKIATVLERSEWHGRELKDHSKRIDRLENKKGE